MTKFLRLASRIAFGSIISDLLELNNEFRRGCGEDIPGMSLILQNPGWSSEKVRATLGEITPDILKLMSTYPAYPCVGSVVRYLEGI